SGPFFGGGVKRPENHQRLANDVLARNETPIAAVERVFPIVAHGEVSLHWNDQLAVLNVAGEHLLRPVGHRPVGLRWKIIAVGLNPWIGVLGVGVRKGPAIDIHHLVHDAYAISGHANHALDEVLANVHGIAEHDDVAAS